MAAMGKRLTTSLLGLAGLTGVVALMKQSVDASKVSFDESRTQQLDSEPKSITRNWSGTE